MVWIGGVRSNLNNNICPRIGLISSLRAYIPSISLLQAPALIMMWSAEKSPWEEVMDCIFWSTALRLLTVQFSIILPPSWAIRWRSACNNLGLRICAVSGKNIACSHSAHVSVSLLHTDEILPGNIRCSNCISRIEHHCCASHLLYGGSTSMPQVSYSGSTPVVSRRTEAQAGNWLAL